MDRALHSVFARPTDHLRRRLAILDGTKPDFTQQRHARLGHFREVFFYHPVFNHRGTCMHLDARGSKVFVPTLRRDRHRLKADDIFWPTRHVHFASRYQGGYTAMQGRIDPPQLLLSRRIVPHHRVHMAVDQPGRKGRTMGINFGGGRFAIHVFLIAPCADLTVVRDQAVAIKNRHLHFPRKDHADVSDH